MPQSLTHTALTINTGDILQEALGSILTHYQGLTLCMWTKGCHFNNSMWGIHMLCGVDHEASIDVGSKDV